MAGEGGLNIASQKGSGDETPFSLTGRSAIVTGAGAGLGRAYALALASRGAKVLVNDLGADLDGSGSDRSSADAVVEEIVVSGGEAVADHSTVATPEGGEQIVERALDAFGRVDILVNNAGNMRLSSFAKLDARSVDEIIDVHLGGAFYVTLPAYRAMQKQSYGRIVFTTSGLGIFGIYGASAYAAAKGGINGLLTVLRLESERYGIKVNAIAPMARTRMSGDDLYSEVPEDAVGPEHVVPAVEYLVSDGCEVNGEIWSVGAGNVAAIHTIRSPGYFKDPEATGRLTPEEIADHLVDIRSAEDACTFDDWPSEWRSVAARFRGQHR